MTITYESNDGMNVKALINILEELADSHQAHNNITFNKKQYDHEENDGVILI